LKIDTLISFRKVAEMNRFRISLLIATTVGWFALAQDAFSQVWTACTNAPNKEWWSVASSADGNKLVAVVYGEGIYTSTNAGVTWTSNSAPARNWYSVASSADGQKLVAAISALSSVGLGGIYVSANGGSTWDWTSAPNYIHAYGSVASSRDGTRLAAVGVDGVTKQIHVSPDSGATWNLASVPNIPWSSIASSADGMKLVALVSQNNVVYTSPDAGATWAPSAVPSNAWYSVTSSTNGDKLAAVCNGGGIFTSTNSGISWVSNAAPSRNWLCIASSADGNRLVACAPGKIYTTVDSGATWVSNSVPANYWSSVACSEDGTKMVAVAATGQIFTSSPALPSLTVVPSGTNLTISWSSSAGLFQLQQRSNLTAAAWTDATNSVSSTNGQNQATVSKSASQAFYRLRGQ
jgi:hypothetical protein